jgi:hypothetical protein
MMPLELNVGGTVKEMIENDLAFGVKTTLQSNVQLDEMLAAEPYKSVRKVITEQRWPTRCSVAALIRRIVRTVYDWKNMTAIKLRIMGNRKSLGSLRNCGSLCLVHPSMPWGATRHDRFLPDFQERR